MADGLRSGRAAGPPGDAYRAERHPEEVRVDATRDAYDGGAPVAAKTWNTAVPRDLVQGPAEAPARGAAPVREGAAAGVTGSSMTCGP